MPFRNVAIHITNIAIRKRVLKNNVIYIEFSKCSHLGLIEADEGNECNTTKVCFQKNLLQFILNTLNLNEISFASDITIFALTV